MTASLSDLHNTLAAAAVYAKTLIKTGEAIPSLRQSSLAGRLAQLAEAVQLADAQRAGFYLTRLDYLLRNVLTDDMHREALAGAAAALHAEGNDRALARLIALAAYRVERQDPEQAAQPFELFAIPVSLRTESPSAAQLLFAAETLTQAFDQAYLGQGQPVSLGHRLYSRHELVSLFPAGQMKRLDRFAQLARSAIGRRNRDIIIGSDEESRLVYVLGAAVPANPALGLFPRRQAIAERVERARRFASAARSAAARSDGQALSADGLVFHAPRPPMEALAWSWDDHHALGLRGALAAARSGPGGEAPVGATVFAQAEGGSFKEIRIALYAGQGRTRRLAGGYRWPVGPFGPGHSMALARRVLSEARAAKVDSSEELVEHLWTQTISGLRDFLDETA